MKKLKSFSKKAAITLLTMTGGAALACGAAACGAKSQEAEAPANVEITKVQAPTDGSLPTAHTGAENLSYIAHTLAGTKTYHGYSYTVTNASIATQYTYGYRDYKDGVLLATDITYSSMVKSGTQTCVVSDGDELKAYMRFSEPPKSDTTHLTAVWDEGAPTLYDANAYNRTYGLFPTELTNYIINADTLTDCGEVKVNPDGTYTQSYTLDPVASTYYYQFGMKTRGGLGGYPQYEEVKLSVTFNADWRVLSTKIHEVAQVNKGVNVTSVTDSVTTYSYDEKDFDNAHFAFYENYFMGKAEDKDVVVPDLDDGEELTLDVTSVLSNGFASVMNGGQQFEISADIGKNKYKGFIFLGLDLANPLETLKINLSLGKTLEEQTFFVEYADGKASAYYGENFALDVNLAETKLVLNQFKTLIDEFGAALGNAVQETEENKTEVTQPAEAPAEGETDLLSTLLNEIQLETYTGGANLILKSDDLLGLGVGVDVEMLFGVSGKNVLIRGVAVNEIAIGGEALDLNLSLTTTEKVAPKREDTGANANLADFAADIHSLLSSDLIKLSLSFDGDAEEVKIPALNGIKLNADAYVDARGLTVGAYVTASYTRDGKTISADLSAYYGYNQTNSGDVYLAITAINGVKTNIAVKCGINETYQAVENLLAAAGIKVSPFGGETSTLEIVPLINGVLSSDLSGLLSSLSADKSKIDINLSLDSLFGALGINAGVELGDCKLVYAAGEENKGGNLSVNLPALGLNAEVCGADGQNEVPDFDSALDLSQLVNTVTAAYGEVDKIIKNQTVAFKIAEGSKITVDGITAGLDGSGEVDWANKTVALDLRLSLCENDPDVTAIKLVYDAQAGDEAPLVTLSVNGVGMYIYKSDIEGVKDGFNQIFKKVNEAFGTNISLGGAGSSDGGAQAGVTVNKDRLIAEAFKILSGSGWVEALNKIALETDENSLSVKIGKEFSVNLTANGALGLSLGFTGDDGLSAALSVEASSGNGEKLAAKINSDLTSVNAQGEPIYNMVSSKQGETAFIKLAYNYLFDALRAVSVENILGSGTYEVNFSLEGDNCNIAALKGVSVNADLYFMGKSGEESRLTEADLRLNINGVPVDANVVIKHAGANTYFYLTIDRAAQISFNGLKVYATQDDIYNTLQVLVDTVKNTDVLGFVVKKIGVAATTAETPQKNTEPAQAPDKDITDLILALLNFNIEDAFTCTKSGDITQAELDVDEIINLLGLDCPSIGKINAVINHKEHSITTTGSASVKEGESSVLKTWLSLSSKRAEKRRYETFDTSKYINASFISTLIEDAVKTVTDNTGKVYETFSFNGTVEANIVNTISITIDVKALTLGFDSDNSFYFSLVGKLSGAMVSDNTIGLTYHNNLLTVGRNLESSPEYRVMTLNYFIDNMFEKGDNSTLNWLLGVSNLVWNIAADQLQKNVNLSSGAFKTQDIYLYKAQQAEKEQEVSVLDYIKGLSVIINGEPSAFINGVEELENKFGITDNYYGAVLDANLITGGVITKLFAAITRDDTTGINGVKAYGAIQSYVDFTISLNYAEGLTAENNFVPAKALTDGMSAPSLFEQATLAAGIEKNDARFTYSESFAEQNYDLVFGELKVGGGNYEFKNVQSLYTHTLTVERLDGTNETIKVKHGSTVYAYDNEFPVYSDTQRVVYLDENGELIPNFVMTGDRTLTEVLKQSAEISLYNNGQYFKTVNSFVGDTVPETVAGYSMLSDGLYFDSAYTQKASGTISESISLYGEFVKSSVVINDIVYSFDFDKKCYFVDSLAAGYVGTYVENGATVKLENKIGAFDVKYIKEGALANTTGDKTKSIKSVIVPENITLIGKNAFANNAGMTSVVFLADTVTFEGNNEKNGNDGAFYGCCSENNANATSLVIYYNNSLYANASDNFRWTLFSVDEPSPGIVHRYYIGKDIDGDKLVDYDHNGGGKLVSGNSWQYATYTVSVDAGAVGDENAILEAANKTLTASYPVYTEGEFKDGTQDKQVAVELEKALSAFDLEKEGMTYKCVYSAEYAVTGNKVCVNYSISYQKAAKVNVLSAYAITLYGKEIPAGVLTELTVPVEGDTLTMDSPQEATHIFTGWNISDRDGKTVYEAQWRERNTYKLTVNVKKGLNKLYVDGTKVNSISVDVLEGVVNIRIEDSVLYVTDAVHEYIIEVKSTLSGQKRAIKLGEADSGEKPVNADLTITVSY